MRSIVLTTIVATLGVGGATAQAQSWTPPPESKRCPSKWGAADQRGAANHMKPDTVLRATQAIKTGEVIELAHVLNSSMPMVRPGGRAFELITLRNEPAEGSNQRVGHEEIVIAHLGGVGTQFDGLAHNTIGNSFYNCVKVEDVETRNGFTKLGVHNVGTLFTRGVLIDVAGLKGVGILPAGYEITVQDLQQALARAKLTLRPGDAVIINTGEGRQWNKRDPARKGTAGIGLAAAEWLASQDPMLVGSDNGAIGVSPDPDPKLSYPNHQILLVVNGIYIIEHMKLDELAAKGVYEFAFVVQPLKMEGGTASTVSPVAIR